MPDGKLGKPRIVCKTPSDVFIADRIRERARFYDWDRLRGEVRWVTAWDSTPEDVDRFVAIIVEEFARAQ